MKPNQTSGTTQLWYILDTAPAYISGLRGLSVFSNVLINFKYFYIVVKKLGKKLANTLQQTLSERTLVLLILLALGHPAAHHIVAELASHLPHEQESFVAFAHVL